MGAAAGIQKIIGKGNATAGKSKLLVKGKGASPARRADAADPGHGPAAAGAGAQQPDRGLLRQLVCDAEEERRRPVQGQDAVRQALDT